MICINNQHSLVKTHCMKGITQLKLKMFENKIQQNNNLELAVAILWCKQGQHLTIVQYI